MLMLATVVAAALGRRREEKPRFKITALTCLRAPVVCVLNIFASPQPAALISIRIILALGQKSYTRGERKPLRDAKQS
jgi:hypothetical protein